MLQLGHACYYLYRRQNAQKKEAEDFQSATLQSRRRVSRSGAQGLGQAAERDEGAARGAREHESQGRDGADKERAERAGKEVQGGRRRAEGETRGARPEPGRPAERAGDAVRVAGCDEVRGRLGEGAGRATQAGGSVEVTRWS